MKEIEEEILAEDIQLRPNETLSRLNLSAKDQSHLQSLQGSEPVEQKVIPSRPLPEVIPRWEVPTISSMSEGTLWKYPVTDEEKRQFVVFEDLWERGWWISSGIKFGGHLTIYEGRSKDCVTARRSFSVSFSLCSDDCRF